MGVTAREEVPELSVVIPAYNEEERLADTLPLLLNALERGFASFELILVDDGSTDGTNRLAKSVASQNSRVRLITLERNRGKGFAVRQGMLVAAGEYVLFSDADLSTPIREVHKLMASLGSGHDVAIGSRARPETEILQYQPFYRLGMGKIFNFLVRLVVMGGIADTQCGFKCFRRETARRIFSRCVIDGFSFDVEALFVARKLGYRIGEVGVLWRNHPSSRVHPIVHSLEMMLDLLRIRWNGWRGLYPAGEGDRTTIDTSSSR